MHFASIHEVAASQLGPNGESGSVMPGAGNTDDAKQVDEEAVDPAEKTVIVDDEAAIISGCRRPIRERNRSDHIPISGSPIPSQRIEMAIARPVSVPDNPSICS